jgi:type IV pilus assembly protein PilE
MQRQNGVTLIELMIAVVVIAILVAVAYPSYRQQIVRGARSAGQQFLLDIAQRQEQFLLDQRRYAIGPDELNLSVPDEVSTRYLPPVFEVTKCGAPPPCYTITLTPIPGGLMDSDSALIINSLGQRWRDVIANVIVEAMAVGLPVVASRLNRIWMEPQSRAAMMA